MNFLKEFEICPNLITKSTAHLLYNKILETNFEDLCSLSKKSNIIYFLKHDTGTVFTLSRFFAYLIRCTFITNCLYSENKQSETLQNTQKFVELLERMEISNGFLNLEKKTFSTHNSKTSLIIPKNILKQVFLN